ncbi:hypothetical protein BDU57DRAFT_595276 [Ampelomyces quisqualis]|uniref:Uncharacterized protein n=1 Tax=Ampelomyces quisqualis TaxID=50730 RepID=A0A6A5QPC3_AMPQU|nr:hypothetical protein BDU57DRAFT_595276 [Ampelomyces quisqualis]
MSSATMAHKTAPITATDPPLKNWLEDNLLPLLRDCYNINGVKEFAELTDRACIYAATSEVYSREDVARVVAAVQQKGRPGARDTGLRLTDEQLDDVESVVEILIAHRLRNNNFNILESGREGRRLSKGEIPKLRGSSIDTRYGLTSVPSFEGLDTVATFRRLRVVRPTTIPAPDTHTFAATQATSNSSPRRSKRKRANGADGGHDRKRPVARRH